jgi:hypothetical protein
MINKWAINLIPTSNANKIQTSDNKMVTKIVNGRNSNRVISSNVNTIFFLFDKCFSTL